MALAAISAVNACFELGCQMQINSGKDLRGMRRIGEICGLTLKLMLDSAEAGMSTRDLDDIGRDFLRSVGAASAPISAYRFPGFTCISLNDEAAHGVPAQGPPDSRGRLAQC